jgi:excisionase family DNA binding protein
MLQHKPAAAVVYGKTHGRHPKCAPTPRAPRRAEATDEPSGGDDDALLATFAEAERRLRVSRMTLHNLIVAGELRVRRFGRAVRIPLSEIRRLGTPGFTPTK